MSFPLDQFELHIPSDINAKGFSYFKSNQVDNLARDGNSWAADVYGTDDYIVEIDLKNGNVENWFCNCPYDWGPVCKHVAAVLYAIKEQIEEIQAVLEVEKTTTPLKSIARKKTATKDPLDEILSKLNKADLQQAVVFLSQRHEQVRSYFLAKYANLLSHSSKDDFKKMVKSIIDSHTQGRHDFIDYQSATKLGERLHSLLLEADISKHLSMVYLCEEIIRQLANAYSSADDSSGGMGMAIEEAFSKLYKLADKENETPADVLVYIFEYALSESKKPVYQGWDWAGNFRSLATEAIREKAQAEKLMRTLDKTIEIKREEAYSQYDIEIMENLKIVLIKKYDSEVAAENYLQEHLHYPSFRRRALENAFNENNYEKTKNIAYDGIKLDTANGLPGLVNEWKKWLIKLAKKTNDKKTLEDLLEEMYLQQGDMEFYQELKELLSKDEFEKKVKKFLKYFRTPKNANRTYSHHFNYNVANIFIEEKRFDDLMAEVRKSPKLDILDRYSKLLSKTTKVNTYSYMINA